MAFLTSKFEVIEMEPEIFRIIGTLVILLMALGLRRQYCRSLILNWTINLACFECLIPLILQRIILTGRTSNEMASAFNEDLSPFFMSALILLGVTLSSTFGLISSTQICCNREWMARIRRDCPCRKIHFRSNSHRQSDKLRRYSDTVLTKAIIHRNENEYVNEATNETASKSMTKVANAEDEILETEYLEPRLPEVYEEIEEKDEKEQEKAEKQSRKSKLSEFFNKITKSGSKKKKSEIKPLSPEELKNEDNAVKLKEKLNNVDITTLYLDNEPEMLGDGDNISQISPEKETEFEIFEPITADNQESADQLKEEPIYEIVPYIQNSSEATLNRRFFKSLSKVQIFMSFMLICSLTIGVLYKIYGNELFPICLQYLNLVSHNLLILGFAQTFVIVTIFNQTLKFSENVQFLRKIYAYIFGLDPSRIQVDLTYHVNLPEMDEEFHADLDLTPILPTIQVPSNK